MPLTPFLLCLTLLLITPVSTAWAAESQPAPSEPTTADATPETKAPQEHPLPTPRIWQQAGLVGQFNDPSTQIIELSVEGKSIQAFFKEQTGPVRHGGIIFFPDEETHQDWPTVINPLRTELPFAGWATLTVPMPKPNLPALPKRTLPVLKLIKNKSDSLDPNAGTDTPPDANQSSTETTTNSPVQAPEASAPSTETPQTITDYYPAFNELAMAAIQALQQRNIQRIVLAGVGTGATWASAFATQVPEDSNVKLLLINAQQSLDPSAPDVLALLPKLKITTIDLYSSAAINPTQKVPSHDELRLQTVRRHRMNHYHQSRLPEVALRPSGQPWLVRHTRGMLQSYVIKAEKDKKKITIEQQPEQEQPPGTPAPASKPAI